MAKTEISCDDNHTNIMELMAKQKYEMIISNME